MSSNISATRNNDAKDSRVAVLDIQFFHGTNNVREIAIVDVNDLKVVHHNCFSASQQIQLPEIRARWSPYTCYDQDNSKNLLYQVVDLFLSKYDFVFIKGYGKGTFMQQLYPAHQIYLLDELRCPPVASLDKKDNICFQHANRKACALSRSKALAFWCRDNSLTLYDCSTRLLTFRNWTVNVDPEKLAAFGMTHWNGSYTRCVYCKTLISGWDNCEDIADHHSWSSFSCPLNNNNV